MQKYKRIIKEYCKSSYKGLFRNPEGLLKYPFIVPGDCYGVELWDWDSWLTNVALRQIAPDNEELYSYEKGSILNFIINTDEMEKCLL